MTDEIIKELWEIKDRIAREHGYDVDALIAHLQSKQKAAARRVVDLRALKKNAQNDAPANPA